MLRLASVRSLRCAYVWRAMSAASEPPSAGSGASAEGETAPPRETSAPALFFNDLVYRGRESRLLAVGDLRKLLQLCEKKSHVKYAVEAVRLFESKGHDFSEEVNSHFVSACLRGDNPQAAAEMFVKRSYRIGAWSTLKSIDKLVSAMDETSHSALLKDVLLVLGNKGVRFSEVAALKMLRAAVTVDGFVLDTDTKTLVQRTVVPAIEDVDSFLTAHNVSTVAATADAVAGGAEVTSSSA